MKKFLLSAMLLLLGTGSWAQNWVAPSETDYPSENPVYVRVNINGTPQLQATVAAFIDNSCRAVAESSNITIGNEGMYALRVMGDNATDLNKDITFKVSYAGIVYVMTKTIPFTGETYGEIPLELNVDCPTGIALTDPLNIEAKLPYNYDLSNDISFVYETMDASGAPVSYTPLGQSTIETALTYEWDFANSASYLSVEGTKLTALQATGESSAYLGLYIPELGIRGFTNVFISEPVIPVESITANPNTFTMTIHDNLYEMPEVHNAIQVLPEDASNKAYRFVAADDAATAVFEGGSFSEGGTYNINIVSEADENIFTTITVTVTVPVEDISLNSPTGRFFAVRGENIFDLIRPYVTVTPSNATNPNFSFVVPDEASDAIVDGEANQPGIYTLQIVADENDEIMTSVEVVINEVEAPEVIEMKIGENYKTLLDGQITVLPESPNAPFTYTLAPADDHVSAFDENGNALEAGNYLLIATCVENPKAFAEIVVQVSEPVVISFPSMIEMSTIRDNELVLTIESGEASFDPNLLEIEFSSFSDMAFMLGLPTATPVEDTNNLKWTLRAHTCGLYGILVKYDGEYMKNTDDYEMTEVEVTAEVAFNNDGWDWIYVPGYVSLINEDGQSYLAWLNQDIDNRIIDLRSQSGLLYNDANFGLFGDITELTNNDGMYKIKAKYANAEDAVFDTGNTYWENYSSKPIVKGYTWVGYYNEWDLNIPDYNRYIEESYPDGGYFAAVGDQIIGKDGFAEFDGSAWISSEGFYLQKGKGYLYYTESEEAERDIDFGFQPIVPETQKRNLQARTRAAQLKQECVWKYDAGAFADNMAIVATIANLENPEMYTIGAFVGDECRGAGSMVKDGRMMISVAGKAGEVVRFRLHNTETDEYFDINETVNYAGRLGSLQQPLTLSADIATGIIGAELANGEIEAIYDASGRRVNEMTNGTYIVKLRQGNKVITQKVIR